MNKYLIKITNEFGIILYNDTIEAENENKAMLKIIESEIIYSGDKIEIEDYE